MGIFWDWLQIRVFGDHWNAWSDFFGFIVIKNLRISGSVFRRSKHTRGPGALSATKRNVPRTTRVTWPRSIGPFRGGRLPILEKKKNGIRHRDCRISVALLCGNPNDTRKIHRPVENVRPFADFRFFRSFFSKRFVCIFIHKYIATDV